MEVSMAACMLGSSNGMGCSMMAVWKRRQPVSKMSETSGFQSVLYLIVSQTLVKCVYSL